MGISRSENMSRIRSTNTKPELRLRQVLWAAGLRFRLNYRVEKICPDIVFIKSKVAIFVDGCQWHGCPEHYVRPRTKNEFWATKLSKSVERDIAQTTLLRSNGWIVYRAWEHEVWENSEQLVEIIKRIIQTGESAFENDWRVLKVDIIDIEEDIEKRYLLRLLSPETVQIVERQRSTKKWKRN